MRNAYRFVVIGLVSALVLLTAPLWGTLLLVATLYYKLKFVGYAQGMLPGQLQWLSVGRPEVLAQAPPLLAGATWHYSEVDRTTPSSTTS